MAPNAEVSEIESSFPLAPTLAVTFLRSRTGANERVTWRPRLQITGYIYAFNGRVAIRSILDNSYRKYLKPPEWKYPIFRSSPEEIAPCGIGNNASQRRDPVRGEFVNGLSCVARIA